MALLPQNTILGRLRLSEVYHYYDGPKLFVCANVSGQHYLVFWLGDDGGLNEWLYLPVSSTRLGVVAGGEMSLREACLTAEDGVLWRIAIGRNETVLHRMNPADLQDHDLPDPGAILYTDRQTLEPQVEPIEMHALRSHADAVDLELAPESSHRTIIKAKTLGATLVDFQELVHAIHFSHSGFRSRRGRPPADKRLESELNATGTFAASFGIRLESRVHADLFGMSPVTRALADVLELLALGANRDALTPVLAKLGGRVAARYAVLLGALAYSETDLRIRWASARAAESRSYDIKWKDAAQIVDVLMSTLDAVSEVLEFPARVDGIDVHMRSFDLVNLDTTDRITGTISEEYLPTARRSTIAVPGNYRAVLRQTQEVNAVTGEIRETFELADLKRT